MLNSQETTSLLREQFLEEYRKVPSRPDLDGVRLIVHVAQDGLTIQKIAVRLRPGLGEEGGDTPYDVVAP